MKSAVIMGTRRITALGLAAAVLLGAQAAQAGFTDFVIRGGTGTGDEPTIQSNNTYQQGATEFIIDEGGQKAALGSSDVDGQTLGSLTGVSIDRLDDASRFSSGSGPAVAPYLNFWITDGTNYAVVANEPSNPDFSDLYDDGYDLDFSDLSDKVANIYENDDTSWLPNDGNNLTFADLASLTIQAPSPGEQTWSGLGTGAPRELGTDQAYGVNWVFGDTLSNYVSGDEGYVVANASVSSTASVPTPGSLALLAVGLLGLAATSRRCRTY